VTHSVIIQAGECHNYKCATNKKKAQACGLRLSEFSGEQISAYRGVLVRVAAPEALARMTPEASV
jgi:hypothetical protein